MGWHLLHFLPPRSLSEDMQLGRSPWPWEWEICGLSTSYLGRAQFLSASGFTVIFKCPPEAKSSYLPCSCCYFYLKCKQEAGCKCLTQSPSIPGFKKYEQEASCKCLAWSPSVSCLWRSRQKLEHEGGGQGWSSVSGSANISGGYWGLPMEVWSVYWKKKRHNLNVEN